MALFTTPEEHAANPPSTWTVEKIGDRHFAITIKGVPLQSYDTRREARLACTEGFLVDLYEKERRWYAGEQVDHWRPWSELRP